MNILDCIKIIHYKKRLYIMPSCNFIKNALISVSDKLNILEIAQTLIKYNVKIFSTGGTTKFFQKKKIPTIQISEYTEFPEIMDGRVKTLHPKIMAGILGRRNKDQKIMQSHNIIPIDLVIVNFYPISTIQKKNVLDIDNFINNIDIGGPTLVRAAAKNYKDVIIIVDINDLQYIIENISSNQIDQKKRFDFASKAFQYTLLYEKKIVQSFSQKNLLSEIDTKNDFPDILKLRFLKKQDLRYGENQHQKSAFYIEKNNFSSGNISSSHQVQGKKLSYNNISDADIALECVKEFSDPACVIVKHGNPCGVAVSNSLIQSYLSAYHADSISAFGAVIAFNNILDKKTAEIIINNQFVEVIIVPEIHTSALTILQQKKNIRILISGPLNTNTIGFDLKRVSNGLLVQEYDNTDINCKKWNIVTKRSPTETELKDAIFCWKVAKFVKSNAIVYGRNNITIGIGAGQMSRLYSSKIANIKAQEKGIDIVGATMSSDAFFPFRDSIDSAASVGINCIVQPGGSIRDQEVINAANEHNISMIFTYIRHFKH